MYLYGKHCKETYVNGILKTIRSFFKYCVSEEYINENPTLKVSWAKEEKSVIATFTNEEVIKMIDFYNCDSYAGARNKTILAMLFDTGIRNSELCGLLKSDVQSENLRIKGKGKKGTYQ
jgi:integrase/recombinase XerD